MPKRGATRRLILSLAFAAGVGCASCADARSIAACMAEAGTVTASDETANGLVDGLAEAADAGLPVMDAGIVLSLNQINANLANLLGPLTEVAMSTCDTNDTLSTAANPADFAGWTSGVDVAPQPTSMPAVLNGRRIYPSPFSQAVRGEDLTNLHAMELDLKGGYSPASIANEQQGLINMVAMALSGIQAEKLALTAAEDDVARFRAARNVKDLLANQLMILHIVSDTLMRANIVAQQQRAELSQQKLFEMDRQKMFQDDHLKAREMLATGA